MDGGNFIARTARSWMMAFGLLAPFMFMIPAAHARDVPDGWEARAENNGTTFAPAKMNSSEKFEVWVAGTLFDAPQGVSLQNLLLQIRQQAGVQGGQCEPAQASQEGVAMQNCMDGNMALQYMLLPSTAGAGKVQLLRVRAAGSDEALEHYRDGYQQVLKIAMQGRAQNMRHSEGKSEEEPELSDHIPSLPNGWKVSRVFGGAAFAPIKMNPGEELEVWVDNSLIGLRKGAILQNELPRLRVNAPRSSTNGKCQPPKITPEGLATQTCVAGNATQEYILRPIGTTGTHAELLSIRAAGDGVLERYRDGFQQTLEIVMGGQAQKVLSRQEQLDKLERNRIARAIRTAPGQGVQDGDIAAVYVTWRVVQLSGETASRMEYATWLLLKDGIGTGYPELFPPDELNVKISQQLQPKRWFQWRKPLLGNRYEIRGPDDKDWRPLSQGWVAQPARPGERLIGAYRNSTAYGSWMTGSSTSSSTWSFKGDGTFESSSYGTSATGSMQALVDGTVLGSSAYADSKGSRATSFVSTAKLTERGLPLVAGGTTQRTNDGDGRRGRYRLKGWVLEVERDNSQFDRYFVSFQGDKRDTINIGGSQFSIPTR